MVVRGGMTSTFGPVSGPISWGRPPMGQWISTPPVGRCRCTYGSAPVRWIQTVRTTPARAGTGERSTYSIDQSSHFSGLWGESGDLPREYRRPSRGVRGSPPPLVDQKQTAPRPVQFDHADVRRHRTARRAYNARV